MVVIGELPVGIVMLVAVRHYRTAGSLAAR